VTDCIFCKIGRGEIPAKEVARTSGAVAFHDLNPQAPVHLLVVPVTHLENAAATDSEEGARVISEVMRLSVQVARQLGLEGAGYRMVLNVGKHGGQSVGHLHVHVLGGRQMAWPPG
jgi:histidine triad (HIT) family protein